MAPPRPTLKELAAELDISVATVSRALGGYEDISLKTRERVSSKAREMGYVANSAGRMLRSGRSDFVGLVVPVRGPHLVDAFLGEFVTGLGEQLTEHGLDLILATTSAGKSEMDVLRKVVESGRADGVILNRIAETDDRVKFLQDKNFPFVTHGRVLGDELGQNWIDTDGSHAFREAFEVLYSLGHRKFGLLTIDDPMTFRHFREAGLEDAIATKSDPDVSLQRAGAQRFDEDGLRAACRGLLSAQDRPTAVLALFDELAVILLREAEKLGISVPDQLSIIGYDNLPSAAVVPPGLTTFDQQIRTCSRALVDMLVGAIRAPEKQQECRLFQPKFLPRGTHGPAPKL